MHGGFGFSSHTHGLALDFVVGATVVLADGNVVETSATNRADLFWGIRGAGSNFGIVAAWKLTTIPAPPTLARFIIPLHWNKSTALQGLLAVETFVKTKQPQGLNFRIGDYGKGNPQIEALFYGTLDEGRAALQPLLDAQPAGWEITEASSLNWIQAVISFSNYETVDYTTPAPVSTSPYYRYNSTDILTSQTAREFLRQELGPEGSQRHLGRELCQLLLRRCQQRCRQILVLPA